MSIFKSAKKERLKVAASATTASDTDAFIDT